VDCYIMNDSGSLFVLGSFVVACSATVASLPEPGESLRADAFKAEAGGKGLNLALGALRLGASVDGLFAVGNDLFADFARSAFVEAGLAPAMLRSYNAVTGAGIGFTDARGENCLAVYPGANLCLDADAVRAVAPALQAADLVLAPFEIGDEPIAEAFSLARSSGARTVLNPSPYREIDPDILQNVSVLVLNRTEAAQMAGSSNVPEASREPQDLAPMSDALLRRGPELVVVTLGADGAIAFAADGPPLRQPAFSVNVVDTLGAGDAFTAGLAVSLAEGRPLRDCVARASACGAMVCRAPGVFDWLPSAHALAQFLEERKPPSSA
jgi:ribokinase